MKTIIDFIRDTLSLAGKDLQVISKDRGGLLVLFLLPLLGSTITGSIYAPLLKEKADIQFPVYLVNQDEGRYGSQVEDILRQVDYLEMEEKDAPEEAKAEVANSNAVAAILIPPDFSQKIDAYEQTNVVVIIDPVQIQYGRIVTGIVNEVVSPVAVQGEVQHGINAILEDSGLMDKADAAQQQAIKAQSFGAVMTQVQEYQNNPLIKTVATTNEGVEYTMPPSFFTIFIPSFTVMFAFFIVPGISSELLQEKRQGSMRRLLAAPVARGSIIAGKMLAYLVIVFLQVLVIFGIGNLAFGMPLGESYLGLLLVTIAMGLSATGLGMMVAALSKTDRQANSIGMVLGFLLAGLGGCFPMGLIPLYESGGVIEIISRLTPNSHALMAFRDLMMKNASAVDVLPQVGILLVFALVFFAVAVSRFKYE